MNPLSRRLDVDGKIEDPVVYSYLNPTASRIPDCNFVCTDFGQNPADRVTLTF